MDQYVKGTLLGKGTFGVVIKATHKETGKVVAIKKIGLGKAKEGVNVTALREIKLLKELHGPHIVQLLDVFPHKQNLSLVFEYMQTDLEVVIKDRSLTFSEGDVKAYMQMVLQGINFCHKRWVLHRDIKPNNFLISQQGDVKLGDFGLARIFGSPDRKWTNQVFATWYRPPELFFGSTCYGPGIDMWAAGCIFAELIMRRPWFVGGTDLEILGKIFQAFGTPTEAQWPGMRDLPNFVDFQKTVAPPLASMVKGASDDALDLLSRMMQFDPARRLSAEDALKHKFFTSGPPPTPAAQLPRTLPTQSGPVQLPLTGPSAVQQAPEPHHEDLHPHMGLAGDLGMVQVKRQKLGDGQSQLTPAGQQLRTYTDKAGSGDDDFKPTLLSDDARYLRKRKLHMDSMLESAADS
ncbi:hypothetical protein WJX82_002302 [Trebouxia sp. C0006]